LTYAINSSSCALTLIDAATAGGSSPRQFSLNTAGDKTVVSVQNVGWVVVFERDAKMGKVGKVGERVAVVGDLERVRLCVQPGMRKVLERDLVVVRARRNIRMDGMISSCIGFYPKMNL
jgi:hypothetical protein